MKEAEADEVRDWAPRSGLQWRLKAKCWRDGRPVNRSRLGVRKLSKTDLELH